MSNEISPPTWRKDAQVFRSVPVCRSCLLQHGLDPVAPFPMEHTCNVAKCENPSSYLVID